MQPAVSGVARVTRSEIGRPRNFSEYVDIAETLYNQGVRDALGGGVPACAVADELDVWTNTAREQLQAGVEHGRLERVQGADPGTLQPRTSFIPTSSEADS